MSSPTLSSRPAPTAAFGSFMRQGQICLSTRKIIVERPIAEAFIARLSVETAGLPAGDPKSPDTIIDEVALITDVPADCDHALHETFGPVAAVEIVDSAEGAVRRANATSYGVASGILTGNPERGLALAEEIAAGIVHVNDPTVGSPRCAG